MKRKSKIPKPLTVEPDDGCKCESVSMYCASLIPQPWMHTPKHIPATLCLCGARYYSYSAKAVFQAKGFKATTPARRKGK